MANPKEKLAKMLRTSADLIVGLDSVPDMAEKVVLENDAIIDSILTEAGLDRNSSAEEVGAAIANSLAEKLSGLRLDEIISVPKPEGFFVREEKAAEILQKFPPLELLNHFGAASIKDLLQKEDIDSILASLRFTESQEWMHEFFDKAYAGLEPNDFVPRPARIKTLDGQWLELARKFVGKKLHNVSHLKEFGIIFIIPEENGNKFENLRVIIMLLHYLNEVSYYSRLFRKFSNDADFVSKLKSLLRGDVPALPAIRSRKPAAWAVIQRYLFKEDPNDPRLFMPHVNPEAEHWYKVSERLGITDWNWCGDFFKTADNREKFVSFNFTDVIMSQAAAEEYSYHQQEALWNRIFTEYTGRDRMNELIEENIIKGFIEL
ncbi:MAG: hypothetical protein UY36_C0003G0008 [Parcubacteria group bacterium GW2011_GWA1_49_11]|uniref:Uncharacterized protein n=1 Tax=Candidatus Yanofskybacteria bacterium RIFCSPHIGHO2_01_FULL_48_25b TaxID=1802672 RepID=A0A1F8F5G3_9BACT|nr:MAG: hypothetical protein UY36_C0003G0008 [Parcubacteria group bacterium GW2011_GWA1_49_11]OGN07486.1 MAG: hypothetical protein A2669_02095 [Candidatus Yanofskybacteria bacterium RIFCSPHIGHO2_01_FULL_48_25b]